MTEVEVNNIICAKTDEDKNPNVPKYWILLNAKTGNLYHPANNFDTVYKGSQGGIAMWAFRRVNPTCYKNYIKFLTTNSEAWYRRAEREIINAPT